MMDHEYFPATKKPVYLDKQMFATIICMIPAGKLTTEDAICDMWAKRKGADYCEIEGGGIMPFDKKMFWTPADVQRISHSMDALAANIELKSPAFEISRIMRDFFLELAGGQFLALKKQNPC